MEEEDFHVMQDAQDDRSQICLNYVTKGPNLIANIYVLKSKIKINKT